MIWYFLILMVIQTVLFFALMFTVKRHTGLDAEDVKYCLITFIPFVGIIWSVVAIFYFAEPVEKLCQKIADWANGDKNETN